MAEVETSREGGVLTITLNRPEVLQRVQRRAARGARGALKEARADDVRAVVLTGAGRGFCVGQDLTEFREVRGRHRASACARTTTRTSLRSARSRSP